MQFLGNWPISRREFLAVIMDCINFDSIASDNILQFISITHRFYNSSQHLIHPHSSVDGWTACRPRSQSYVVQVRDILMLTVRADL
jgi:hypothetical protein